MIASMMMYDRPEVAAEHAAYWAQIRASLAKRGIETPAQLSNTAPEFDVWKAPDLVFSQTCGLPYRAFLAEDVTLIGTPDFGHEGCAPGYYDSPVVVRADDPRESFAEYAQARMAYNQDHSQSGYGAMYQLAQAHGFWFADMVASGAHVASAQMVADGKADIAAIDAQTWRYICRFDSLANDLRVIGRTPATPSHPYIAGKHLDGDVMFDAISEAIEALTPQVRQALDLKGLLRISKAEYLAVENPPAPA